jgi:hypothetical protein
MTITVFDIEECLLVEHTDEIKRILALDTARKASMQMVEQRLSGTKRVLLR